MVFVVSVFYFEANARVSDSLTHAVSVLVSLEPERVIATSLFVWFASFLFYVAFACPCWCAAPTLPAKFINKA